MNISSSETTVLATWDFLDTTKVPVCVLHDLKTRYLKGLWSGLNIKLFLYIHYMNVKIVNYCLPLPGGEKTAGYHLCTGVVKLFKFSMAFSC